MTQIWLIRHGEAASSWAEDANPGLSQVGFRQAQQTSTRLDLTVPADARLLTSPLQRAVETGQPFADLRKAPLEIDGRFTEIPSPVPLAERQDWLRQLMSQSWGQQPESLHRWRKALLRGLLESEAPTVIFTHFLVINTVLSYCRSEASILQAWPANGSIHHFAVQDGGLKEISLGEMMSSHIN